MSKEVKNEKLGKRVPLFESKEIKPVTESINKDFVEIIVNNNTSKEVQKEISKLYKPSWTGIEAEDNYNDEVSFPISQSLGFNNEDDLISDLNKNLSKFGNIKIRLTESNKPTDATIKPHMNQYSVSDDPYDVAEEIGKKYGWNQKQIEKAEQIIRKKYIK